MKIAVDFQSGPRMIAFTTDVTHAWPELTRAGGCSLTPSLGITHDTFGSVPRRAARKKFVTDWMFFNWPFWRTVVNHGSGFQIPGVPALWWWLLQKTAPSSRQSGSSPLKT